MKKLNLGSGKDKREGFVNLDVVKMDGVDVVWDLNEYPYPFKDGEFDYIEARDILEHLDDLVSVMEELHRILKKGGELFIRVPDGRIPEAVWDDPTHKRGFTHRTFDYFDPTTFSGQNYGFYSKAKFKVVKIFERNRGLEYNLIKV